MVAMKFPPVPPWKKTSTLDRCANEAQVICLDRRLIETQRICQACIDVLRVEAQWGGETYFPNSGWIRMKSTYWKKPSKIHMKCEVIFGEIPQAYHFWASSSLGPFGWGGFLRLALPFEGKSVVGDVVLKLILMHPYPTIPLRHWVSSVMARQSPRPIPAKSYSSNQKNLQIHRPVLLAFKQAILLNLGAKKNKNKKQLFLGLAI